MTVQSMLTSPHLAEKRAAAEVWAERLAELEEILDLWLDAQTLWLSLLKVFEDPEMFKKMGNTSLKFESVHLKLTVSVVGLNIFYSSIKCTEKDWMRLKYLFDKHYNIKSTS